ncbi:MAG: PHP domain-containing protein [Clostridia bacterium]|nr:PHP domain-containing protein [Clostridia bacterium]
MKYYYDLHIHSCLSPCGDADMTPYNLVNMAKIMGLDLIALTDHNTCGNCRAAMEVGRQTGITVVPGMELCTAEEVHTLCLFPDIDRAEAFWRQIRTTLPPIRNKPKIFGEQLYMDAQDHILGEEEILLLTGSSVSEAEILRVVGEYGGFCLPAHIDRSAYSIISQLGVIDESFGFTAAEIYDRTQTQALKDRFPALNDMLILHSSDAHYLDRIREPLDALDLPENTPEALIDFLKNIKT